MTRACAGRIATAFTMREDPGPLLRPFGAPGRWLGERIPVLFRRKPDVLLKLVFANLNLDWLGARFPQARQLCVLRHPCGQFESWRRLGWEPRPDRLLEIPQLVADHLQPFADLLRRAQRVLGAGGGALGRDDICDPPADAARVPARDRGVRVALRRPGGAVSGAVPPAWTWSGARRPSAS